MSAQPYGFELNRLATLWAEQPESTCFAAFAEALRKRGALDDASRIVAEGIAARPEFLPGHLVLARVSRDRQDWVAVHEALETVLLLDPGNPVALEELEDAAWHLAGTEQTDAAHSPGQVLAAESATAEAAVPVEIEPFQPAISRTDDAQIQVDGAEDDSAESYSESDTIHLEGDEPSHEPVLTESLAMLYRRQGHLADAVDVFEALVARSPENSALAARRDAVRAEWSDSRPRPYDATASGGKPVRQWLSGMATAGAPEVSGVSSFDAFYQPPATPRSDDGDLAAFQAWLKELER